MKLFKILTAIGFIILVGTAGASDLDQLSLVQTLTRCMAGGGLTALGFLGQKLCKATQKSKRTRRKVIPLAEFKTAS